MAKKHVLVPISSVAGWTGKATQLRCRVCKAKTTMVCVECSDSHSVVPLCKKVHTYAGKTVTRHCLKRHLEAPEDAVACVSRSSGKRPRSMPFSSPTVMATVDDEAA